MKLKATLPWSCWHHVRVSLRMSSVALPLTMYRPRPLQRCSTTLFFLLTSLTWALLSVWLGAWHRELDPPRLVSPYISLSIRPLAGCILSNNWRHWYYKCLMCSSCTQYPTACSTVLHALFLQWTCFYMNCNVISVVWTTSDAHYSQPVLSTLATVLHSILYVSGLCLLCCFQYCG